MPSDPLPIEPIGHPVDAVVRVPGSKSITNRALILAALAEGQSSLDCPLESDDTRYMRDALRQLGVGSTDMFIMGQPEPLPCTRVFGATGKVSSRSAELYVGNSGTSARFLAAFVSLGHGTFRIDGVERMRQRPIQELLDAINALGCNGTAARSLLGTGCPPLEIVARGLCGGRTRMRGEVSSQYLTALLMVAPRSVYGVEIEIDGELASKPYVDMTVEMMQQWGATVIRDGYRRFSVSAGSYKAQSYWIEPDASAASYFFAAAAVTGGRVRIGGLGNNSLQGDVAFVDVLERMGCSINRGKFEMEVTAPNRLNGIDVDMNAISDTVMTLAAIAPFADSPTIIRNVAHIRHKETDRIAAVCTELRRLGVEVEERPDGMTIYPAKEIQPAEVETYDDHRMAMSFAITGLRAPGISIKDPGCVAKTFPDFFDRLKELY